MDEGERKSPDTAVGGGEDYFRMDEWKKLKCAGRVRRERTLAGGEGLKARIEGLINERKGTGSVAGWLVGWYSAREK